MEHQIDEVLSNILASPKTTGCLIANNQGLCIEKKGEISANASGLLVAILEHAGKLEPNSNPPIVSLESDKTTCLIHRHGVTGVVYKEISKQ